MTTYSLEQSTIKQYKNDYTMHINNGYNDFPHHDSKEKQTIILVNSITERPTVFLLEGL